MTFATLGCMLRELEQGRLVEEPKGDSRKTKQALVAYRRCSFFHDEQAIRWDREGDVFERLSPFYKGWRDRSVLAFCSHRKAFGFLSNWYVSPFVYEACGVLSRELAIDLDATFVYQTAEQCIMHIKASICNDRDTFDKITNAYEQDLHDTEFIAQEGEEYRSHEEYIKTLGRRIVGWDERRWQQLVLIVATSVAQHKFKNPDLAEQLVGTGDAILAEGADYDSQWGIFLKDSSSACGNLEEWKGWNVLGESLMIVRHHLQTNEALWQPHLFSVKF